MALFPRKSAPAGAKGQPLYQRIQDWIFKVDVGSGLHLFRVMLFCFLVLLIVILYTGTQFQGLRDAEAMELGQLARNKWRYGAYVTQTIRPMALYYLAMMHRPPLYGEQAVQPELWNPPGYPLVLSTVFRVVKPDFRIASGMRTLRADRLLMLLSWSFYLAGMVLLYLLAREMFDHRVGVLSLFLYLFCEPLLNFAISGLPMNLLMLLFLLVCYGLWKAEKWQQAGQSARWVYGALAVSALALGFGTLTSYAFAALVLPVLIYVLVSFPKQRPLKFFCVLGLFLLVLAPWVLRNWRVSRTPFGLTPYCMWEDTAENTYYEIKANQLQRSFSLPQKPRKLYWLARKAITNVRVLYETTLKDVGSNYLIAFFLAALLHRFRQDEVFRLRRLVFWGLLAAGLWLAVSGPPRRNFLTVFMPLVIIYAAAFFYVLFERLHYRKRILRRGVVTAFVALNAVPFLFRILPPRTSSPYPPYDAGIGTALGRVFSEKEFLASDIPWAVAWYSDRSTLWIPTEGQDYLTINDSVRFISGIYLTQMSLQDYTVLDLLGGKPSFVLRLFQPPPQGFPLKYIFPVTPDRQQVILASRRL